MAGGCLVLGPLADSIGRRPMALASLTLLTASMAFSALAPDMTQLMVWRFITGAGVGARVSVAYPLSVEFSNIHSRPITLALMVISFPLGSAVCGLNSSDFIVVFGWRAPFLTGDVPVGQAQS